MKLTREQFDAFEAWLDAKLALAAYQARDGDYYGPLSESSRESETKADLMAALVEDAQPEPNGDAVDRSLIESLIRRYRSIPDYALEQMAETGNAVPGYSWLPANTALAILAARTRLKA